MPVARAAALVLGLLSVALAHATSQRTFVASTGVDTNTAFNCSIAKPCRGFAAAIGVTSAKGEVIVLDSAGYGPIASITKSITITAPTGIYAGISVLSGDGIIINAATNDTVVLRGLTINGEGGANGITINNALVVHVENSVIANMSGMGINALNGLLEVKDTIVRNNGNTGVYVVSPATANLDHVRLEANNTGLAAEFGGHVAMQDSLVTGSANIGVLSYSGAAANPSTVTISRSLISANAYGLYGFSDVGRGAFAVSDSTIAENGVGLYVSGITDVWQYHATHNTIVRNDTGIQLESGGQLWLDGNFINGNRSKDLIADASSAVYSSQNNFVGLISVLGFHGLESPF